MKEEQGKRKEIVEDEGERKKDRDGRNHIGRGYKSKEVVEKQWRKGNRIGVEAGLKKGK